MKPFRTLVSFIRVLASFENYLQKSPPGKILVEVLHFFIVNIGCFTQHHRQQYFHKINALFQNDVSLLSNY